MYIFIFVKGILRLHLGTYLLVNTYYLAMYIIFPYSLSLILRSYMSYDSRIRDIYLILLIFTVLEKILEVKSSILF